MRFKMLKNPFIKMTWIYMLIVENLKTVEKCKEHLKSHFCPK